MTTIDDRLAGLRMPAVIYMAAGLLGMGALNLIYRDLLLQWQPAPADAGWRMAAGVVSGGIFLLSGLFLLTPATRRWGAVIGTVWMAGWALAFQLPPVVQHGSDVSAWLGLAEGLGKPLGLAILLAESKAEPARIVRMAFGACALIFGLSHFAYAAFTAAMVPAWVPMHLAVAYLTGAIHAGTGACLLLGLAPRRAAAIEAAMMTAFVLLLHLPRVIATPGARIEWTMLAVAVALSGAAWLIATSRQPERR